MLRIATSVIASLAAVAAAMAAPAIAADTAPRAKAAGPSVSVKVVKAAYTGGERVVIKGKVSTERKIRRKVELHANPNALGWGKLAVARTNAKGAYVFRFAAPNPAVQGKVKFRVRAVATTSKRLRPVWRKAGTSKVSSVTFAHNPAIVAPVHSLDWPASCATDTVGVHARSSACVAALEVQQMERLWLDAGLINTMFGDPSKMLQFGMDSIAEPTTTAEELANMTLLAPYTAAMIPASALESGIVSYEQAVGAAVFASFLLPEVMAGLFPGATLRTAWKPEWTQHFLLQDLTQVAFAGDTATTPKRVFKTKTKDGSASVTLGGTWHYLDGRWVQAEPPTPRIAS